jgi:hypothetical protein
VQVDLVPSLQVDRRCREATLAGSPCSAPGIVPTAAERFAEIDKLLRR